MDKNTFNSDKFNTWTTCKRRYFYKYVKELRWPEIQDNYRLGQSVHALVDYHLRGLRTDHLLKNADEDIKTHWQALMNHPILKNQVVATEWSFNSKVGKYWLNGRIDAVFYDRDQRKYIIADWKTGQNIPKDEEKDFQSKIYLYSLFKARNDLKLDIKQEDIIFQYIKTPKLEEIPPIEYSASKETEYETIFLNLINEIEKEKKFLLADHCPLKNYCQYRKLCLSGQT